MAKPSRIHTLGLRATCDTHMPVLFLHGTARAAAHNFDCISQASRTRVSCRQAGIESARHEPRGQRRRLLAAHLDAIGDLEEALGGALAGAEHLVAVVDVAGQQGSAVGVSARDQHGGGALHLEAHHVMRLKHEQSSKPSAPPGWNANQTCHS